MTDITGSSGNDTFTFAPGTVAAVDGTAGQIYRLYEAAFDRKPDLQGLGFWIGQADAGLPLSLIANNFMASSEFENLYGPTPSNAALVQAFYQHVLHRDADPAGVRFWAGVLDRHEAGTADVLVGISESPEHVASLVGVMQNGIQYQAYLAA